MLKFFFLTLSSQNDPHGSSWLDSSLNRSCDPRPNVASDRAQPQLDSPSSSPAPRGPTYAMESQDSLSSLPDRADPTTVTKTFRAGRKASAQASLASRDKTPKTRRRRGKTHKNTGEPGQISTPLHSSALYLPLWSRGTLFICFLFLHSVLFIYFFSYLIRMFYTLMNFKNKSLFYMRTFPLRHELLFLPSSPFPVKI